MRAARAEATATCTANGPVLSGSGEVPAVVLGGRTLDVTPLEQVVERLPTGEINVATGGPAARVRCGRGNDVGRFNINERKRVKGCERRYSIR